MKPPTNGYGDWEKAFKVLTDFQDVLSRNGQRALLKAGERLASRMRERILDGTGFQPLSPMTAAVRDFRGERGTDKPLVVTGSLIQSIGITREEPGEVFVGVHRTSDRDAGRNVAAIHEREGGTFVRVTEKMRRFLAAAGVFLRAKTTALFIPGRPFVAPAYRDFLADEKNKEIFATMVDQTMQGKG